MAYVIVFLCVIIFILLLYKGSKFQAEKETLKTLKNTIKHLEKIRADIDEDIHLESKRLKQIKQDCDSAAEEYSQKIEQYRQDTENSYIEITKQKQRECDHELQEIVKAHELRVSGLQTQYENLIKNLQEAEENMNLEFSKKKNILDNQILDSENKYKAIIEVCKNTEEEEQKKLFYTIQVPEEYKSDIDYLLNTVSPQVKHPDILSKLIWQEYVKPNLDNTLKRVEIGDESGIYKITSLKDNKSYIGKSVNLKKRIQDHFKSVVGITSIADQAVHHQILKEGFWNWTIEKVCECPKEELSEKEKFYIDFFKANTYGYNKNSGG